MTKPSYILFVFPFHTYVSEIKCLSIRHLSPELSRVACKSILFPVINEPRDLCRAKDPARSHAHDIILAPDQAAVQESVSISEITKGMSHQSQQE